MTDHEVTTRLAGIEATVNEAIARRAYADKFIRTNEAKRAKKDSIRLAVEAHAALSALRDHLDSNGLSDQYNDQLSDLRQILARDLFRA